MNDSYFTGLLQGFTGRKREVEKENIRQADLAAERENAILTTLVTHGTPDVQALALSSLLEGTQKKAAGLSGWIGKRQQSPAFQQLQQYIKTPTLQPVEEPGPPTLGSTQFAGGAALGQTPQGPRGAEFRAGADIVDAATGALPQGRPQAALTAPPPPTAAGAMPTTSPVQPGAPPPTPVSVVQAPPTPTTITRMALRPKQVFVDPIDTYTREQIAKNRADIEGDVQAYMSLNGGDRQAALKQVMAERLHNRGGAVSAARAQAGSAPDAEGKPTPAWAVWHPALMQFVHPGTTTPFPEFQPASALPKQTPPHFYGVGPEAVSAEKEFGGIPFAQQTPEGAARVNAEVQRRKVELAQRQTAARGVEQVNTRLHMPIGPTAGQQYNVPPTTTLAELNATPGITEAEKTKIASIGMADESVASIEDLVRKVFPEVEPGTLGGIHTAFSLGMQKLSRDEDLAALDAAINLASINIARVAGETGRIPVQLVDKATVALGSIHPDLFGGDTRQTALAKLQVVKDLLETARAYAPGAPTAGPPPKPTASPTAPGAPPKPATRPTAAKSSAQAGSHKVGDTVLYQGKSYIITGITPDGQATLQAK